MGFYLDDVEEIGASYHVEYTARLRAEVITKLGGKCVACGCTYPLCLDHIKGGGSRERTERDNGYWIYRAVRDDERNDIRLLCHNCNFIAREQGSDISKWTFPGCKVTVRVSPDLLKGE
jgi:hypothetical protein